MKQCLFRDWQGLSFVLFAALSVAAAASPGPGWLPLAGPTPLRFSPAPRPRDNRFVLPVPVPAPEPAPVVSQANKAPPASSAPEPPASIPRAGNGMAQPPVESSPPDAVVSPQMLLKYFTKSTNSAVPVAAPLDFTPPKAAGAPPSRATYETGP
jgi:hypothetical protein